MAGKYEARNSTPRTHIKSQLYWHGTVPIATGFPGVLWLSQTDEHKRKLKDFVSKKKNKMVG